MNSLWKRIRTYWTNYVSVPLYSSHGRQDPYPYYKKLRDLAPVHCLGKEQIWTVSRFEDVKHVMGRPDIYLSSDIEGIEDTLPGIDDPDHARIRKIVSKAFEVRHLASLEDYIRRLAGEHVDQMAEGRRCEFMDDLARPLPLKVVAALLDLDPKRLPDYNRWTEVFLLGDAKDLDADSENGRRGELRELRSFLADRVQECRNGRARGVFSTEVIPFLSDKEALNVLELMLVAGHVTTRYLLGNIAVTLLQNPGLKDSLRANRKLIPAVVEETLRVNSPVLSVLRRTGRDVTLAGQRVPANAIMHLLVGSANHTETRFSDPERFSIERDKKGHLVFGAGVHFCLGAALARLEARVVLETLLERLEVMETAEPLDKIEWDTRNKHMRGPKRLKMNVRAFA